MTEFALCETMTASSLSRWHIRRLTEKGKKLGGGADTKALCGQEVAWDLSMPVSSHIDFCCLACRAAYHKQ